MKKPNRNKYFIIEASTGVMDGFYLRKSDAIGSAHYLSDIWIKSRWMVCQFHGYYGEVDREYIGMMYNEKQAQETLTKHFNQKSEGE